MDIFRKYFGRLLKIWITWVFIIQDVFGLFALVMFFFNPGSSFPWWVSWLFGFSIIVTFGGANLVLFAQLESEKQELQDRINEYEDTRANIFFKKTEDHLRPVSKHSDSFPHGERAFHQHSDYLREDGLPIGIIIGAELKGTKRSEEPGDLIWEITEIDLPPKLVASDKGSFRWPTGSPFDRIEKFRYEFDAKYELPIKIEQDLRSFAQSLSSLGSYRIVIEYRTRRFDSESETHFLILEGDFRQFRDEICKQWERWFSELAQLAKCQ